MIFMKFLGLEIGNWAILLSALGTLVAVSLALYSRKLKPDIQIVRSAVTTESSYVFNGKENVLGESLKDYDEHGITVIKCFVANKGNANDIIEAISVKTNTPVKELFLEILPFVVKANDVVFKKQEFIFDCEENFTHIYETIVPEKNNITLYTSSGKKISGTLKLENKKV